MANKVMTSEYGSIYRLSSNPRNIQDDSYTRLVESLERDADFLMVRGIVVWKVPEKGLSEEGEGQPVEEGEEEAEEKKGSGGAKDPFAGQEGKLVVLGGNQRYRALQDLGYERIPSEWIKMAKHPNGEWFTRAEAERFVLLDNNPEGIAGESDYDTMISKFNAEWMKVCGIDFAQTPIEFQEEQAGDTGDEVEEGEHGENDEKLQDFIKDREASRDIVPEMTSTGFYLSLCFETTDQKMAFLEKIIGDWGVPVTEDGRFAYGVALSNAVGLPMEAVAIKYPNPKPEKELQKLALDGTKDGYEEIGDIPEGEDVSDDEEADEKMVGSSDDTGLGL